MRGQYDVAAESIKEQMFTGAPVVPGELAYIHAYGAVVKELSAITIEEMNEAEKVLPNEQIRH